MTAGSPDGGEDGARPERRLTGVPGADGTVVGPVSLLAEVEVPPGGAGGPEEQARARAALEAVAARLGQAGERLRAAGRTDDAEMLEAAQLMADDPTLHDEVAALALTMPAAAALLAAADRQADLLAAIPDEYLAARAADVRRIGRRAARLAAPTPVQAAHAPDHAALTPGPFPTSGRGETGRVLPPLPLAGEGGWGGEGVAGGAQGVAGVVLVARDLGPADFAEIELEGMLLGGIALAEGSVTSHAAIMARALGVPLVVGLGDAALTLLDGEPVVLDGTAGILVAGPSRATLQAAYAVMQARQDRLARLRSARSTFAATLDGHPVRLLANASTERDVLAGLEAGAEGVGLVRTELQFLNARSWPAAVEHAAAVRPVLRHLSGRAATVRTLDFGGDKTPPFLRGRPERGILLHLSEPGALEAQLTGLLQAAADSAASLRIMLPLVEDVAQLWAARAALDAAQAALGPRASVAPPLGAMIETRAAVANIDALAAEAAFLSIGTNDLVQDILGLDRLGQQATVRMAADPRVLRAIRSVTAAARRHGRTVEVCGEAAGDPAVALLLVGLGVDELSMAPPRLDDVRAAVQAHTLADLRALAEAVLHQESAAAVLALADALVTRGNEVNDETCGGVENVP